MTDANPSLPDDLNASTPAGEKAERNSKDRNHQGLGITIERAGAITAVITSFSLAMSFAYDWGFFSGLGISFGDAPTTMSDHLMTWFMWLPFTLPGLLFVLVLGVTDPVSKRAARLLDKLLWFAKWFGLAILLYWLLFGNTAFLVIGVAFWWMWLMTLRIRNPIVRQRYPMWFRLVAMSGPALFAASYATGYSSATRDHYDARAYVELHEDSVTNNPLVEPVNLLRSFDGWHLVRGDGEKTRWVRSEQVQHIEITRGGEGPFGGILCDYLSVCVGSREGKSRSAVRPERAEQGETTEHR